MAPLPHSYVCFLSEVLRRTICDNLKTGIIAHPREGGSVLNEGYEAMSVHYMIAVMPVYFKGANAKSTMDGTVSKLTATVIVI